MPVIDVFDLWVGLWALRSGGTAGLPAKFVADYG